MLEIYKGTTLTSLSMTFCSTGHLLFWSALETKAMGKCITQTHTQFSRPPHHDRSAILRPTACQIWQFWFAWSQRAYILTWSRKSSVYICVCGALMVPRSLLAQKRAHRPLRWHYTPPDKTTHSITSELIDLWLWKMEERGMWNFRLVLLTHGYLSAPTEQP